MAASFMLSAFVRIDSTNNSLRVDDGGTLRTFDLTHGVYTLGFGDSSPNSSTDSLSYGFTSLLQQMQVDFAISSKFTPAAALNWNWALQTGYNGSSGIAASATGHVWVQPGNATDQILFSSDETTMSPEWFGIGVDLNGYNNYSFSSTNYEDISDFSSALAVVGTRTMGAEGLSEEPKDRGFVADDGTTYWEYLSDDLDSLRELIINGSGLPRDTPNSDHHTFRRFMRRLRLNQAGRKFYYFPDLSVLDWAKWDPNSTVSERRWGQQLFSLDPRQPVAFRDPKRFQTYNQEWQVRLPVIGQTDTASSVETGLFQIDVKSGTFGTQVVSEGTATSTTLIDLSGVAQEDDLLCLFVRAENTNTNFRNVSLWKDSGATERWANVGECSGNQSGGHFVMTDEVYIRVQNPASSLWYSWDGTITGDGLDVYVKYCIRGFSWL